MILVKQISGLCFSWNSTNVHDPYYALLCAMDVFVVWTNVHVECTNFAGVYVGPCGDCAIRFRPALIFERQHAELTLDVFESVLKEL